jgi:hypothetical protein
MTKVRIKIVRQQLPNALTTVLAEHTRYLQEHGVTCYGFLERDVPF